MCHAADIVEDAIAVGPTRSAALRAHGLSDEEIAQAAAAAALRRYLSKHLDALGTQPSGLHGMPDGPRAALVRGRGAGDIGRRHT